MTVSPALWGITLLALIGIIALDLVIVDRRMHAFTRRQAVHWILFYVALALAFAAFVWASFGAQYAGQFIAGYLTEYSLSVDNLFVFMIIMSSFAVPAMLQHRVLLVGIVIALILRGILIVAGARLIEAFEPVMFLFAAFLFYTAWKVWTADEDEEPHPDGNALVRFVSKRVPTTPVYDHARLTTIIGSKRYLTPMALVMLAIGTTDLLFALDSIPAVFGITRVAYLVFAANAFALMGLRQLYFLLQDLLSQLVHLSKGIAIILAFIAVKLLLETLHSVFHLNVPTIPVWMSLVVIIVVLGITTITSLRSARRAAQGSSDTPEAA